MTRFTTACAVIMMIAGVSAAQAQNAPTTNISPPPNSINAGNRATMPSGSESQSTAKGRPTASVTGSGKFCAQSSANALDCKYASLSECQKASKADSLHCVANPRTGTTGAR